jgi:hypothetical protein
VSDQSEYRSKLLMPAMMFLGLSWGAWIGSAGDVPEFDIVFGSICGLATGALLWLFLRFASRDGQKWVTLSAVALGLVPLAVWGATQLRASRRLEHAKKAAVSKAAVDLRDANAAFKKLQALTGWQLDHGTAREKTYYSPWDIVRTIEQLKPLGLRVVRKANSRDSVVGSITIDRQVLGIIIVDLGGRTRCEVAYQG